jgi:YYY domain-containing protein
VTTGEAILRWLTVWAILRIASGFAGRRLLGSGRDYLALPLLLLLSGYLYWIWGALFGLPSVGPLPAIATLLAAFVLLWSAGRAAGPREKELGAAGAGADLLFASVLCAALLLRSWMPEITGAEKFPDLMFFQGVFLDRRFPPEDRWLSGIPVNYYYFTHLLFVLPARLGGISPEFAYNLSIATVPALTAAVVGTIARERSGRWVVGIAAAAATVLLSNWEWLRQWLEKGRFFWWDSSRAIEGTITEFPFFSFLLGDLHPHYLALPFLGLTLGVALLFKEEISRPLSSRGISLGLLSALAVGVHYPLNPWELPFLALLSALIWNHPFSKRAATATVAIGLISFLLFLPFWLSYERPVSAFLLVPRALRSSPAEFFLHWGIFLVPCGMVVALAWKDLPERKGWMVLSATLAAGFAFGTSSAMVVGWAGLLWGGVGFRRDRIEDLLIMAALGLILFCELFSLDATYGAALLRLNTVFKFYTMAWWGLALGVPLFLWRERGRFARKRRMCLALLFAAIAFSLVYPVTGTQSRIGGRIPEATLDGMRFWDHVFPGERPVVEWLRGVPPEDVLWEAEGAPYGSFGRISAFSGRPSVLGWANHQGVWRRNGWALAAPRQAEIRALKESPDPAKLGAFVSKYRVKWIVVGALERANYPKPLLDLLGSLPTAFSTGTTTVYAAPSDIRPISFPASSTE